MTEEQGPGSLRTVARFPVLDPEPPPRPWWRRLVVPGTVAVIAGVVVAGVVLPSGKRSQPRAAGPVAAGGRVVLQTPEGLMALADPTGGHVTAIRGLPTGSNLAVDVALDRRFLATSQGQVIAVTTKGLTPIDPAVAASFTPQMGVVQPDGFADHDRALAVVTGGEVPGAGSAGPTSVVVLATDRASSLGTGDTVAGDPAALGVFMSVAAPIVPSATVSQVTADARVERRDVGQAPTVLATATRLNSDLGQDPHLPVGLSPYPDSTGDEVAIVVQPTSPSTTAGIVVVNRSGKVLGTIDSSAGPYDGYGVAWSPDNRSLAYPTFGANGDEVWIRQSRGAETLTPTRTSSQSFGPCLWSPDGSSVLCSASGGAIAQQWVIVPAHGGHALNESAPGIPVAWIPAAPSR